MPLCDISNLSGVVPRDAYCVTFTHPNLYDLYILIGYIMYIFIGFIGFEKNVSWFEERQEL